MTVSSEAQIINEQIRASLQEIYEHVKAYNETCKPGEHVEIVFNVSAEWSDKCALATSASSAAVLRMIITLLERHHDIIPLVNSIGSQILLTRGN